MVNESQTLADAPDAPASLPEIFRCALICYSRSFGFCCATFCFPTFLCGLSNVGLAICSKQALSLRTFDGLSVGACVVMLLAALTLYFWAMWLMAQRIYALKRMATMSSLTWKRAQTSGFAQNLELFLLLVSFTFVQVVVWYCSYAACVVFASVAWRVTGAVPAFWFGLCASIPIFVVVSCGVQLFGTLSFNAMAIDQCVGLEVFSRAFELCKSEFWRGIFYVCMANLVLLTVTLLLSPSFVYSVISKSAFWGSSIEQLPLAVQCLIYVYFFIAYLVLIPFFALLNAYYFKDAAARV